MLRFSLGNEDESSESLVDSQIMKEKGLPQNEHDGLTEVHIKMFCSSSD